MMANMQDGFNDFYNEFKDWTKEQLLHRLYDIILQDVEEIGEKNKEIDRLNNIINELEEWLKRIFDTEYVFEDGEDYCTDRAYGCKQCLDKLNELKENNNG